MSLSLVVCGGSETPALTVSPEADISVSEPAHEERVVEAEPTMVLEIRPVIIEDGPISAASPRISATPVVTPAPGNYGG